jgi:hypothetical protein
MPLPDLSLGGIGVVALTLSTVQAIKEWFSLEGKIVTIVSFVVGGLYAGLALAVQAGFFATLDPIIQIAVGALVFGLNAAGFYKFATSLTNSK